jgi:predicted TIM-barrel enzyme
VLIATGARTGSPTRVDEVEQVRQGTNLPVIVDPRRVEQLINAVKRTR